MANFKRLGLTLGATALLGACATIPEGPSVTVLPGTGKSFDQFRADEYDCRQYASSQIGGSSPNEAVQNDTVKSAAVGTVVGALAGAAIGGSHDAGIGAGLGLLFGSAIGASTSQSSGYAMQRRYDMGYQQCMYARGHRVPVAGRVESGRPAPAGSTAGAALPPPPPGSPPPHPSTIVR